MWEEEEQQPGGGVRAPLGEEGSAGHLAALPEAPEACRPRAGLPTAEEQRAQVNALAGSPQGPSEALRAPMLVGSEGVS